MKLPQKHRRRLWYAIGGRCAVIRAEMNVGSRAHQPLLPCPGRPVPVFNAHAMSEFAGFHGKSLQSRYLSIGVISNARICTVSLDVVFATALNTKPLTRMSPRSWAKRQIRRRHRVRLTRNRRRCCKIITIISKACDFPFDNKPLLWLRLVNRLKISRLCCRQ